MQSQPTMGGAFIVPAWLAVVAVGGGVMTLMGFDPVRVWSALGLGALVVLGNAALGFYDDYCKLTKRGKDGISSRAKLAAQTLIAVAAAVGAWWLVGEEGRVLVLPFANVDIGLWMIPLLSLIHI